MSKGRIFLAGLMLLFVPLLCGCETLGLGTTGDGGGLKSLNILSTQEEIKLGQECSAEVEKTEPLLNNPAVQTYVAGIADRLARVATRTDVTYSVKVIDKPDTVNAFALPGGFMYVYTGLMKICENEAELAAVRETQAAAETRLREADTLRQQLQEARDALEQNRQQMIDQIDIGQVQIDVVAGKGCPEGLLGVVVHVIVAMPRHTNLAIAPVGKETGAGDARTQRTAQKVEIPIPGAF